MDFLKMIFIFMNEHDASVVIRTNQDKDRLIISVHKRGFPNGREFDIDYLETLNESSLFMTNYIKDELEKLIQEIDDYFRTHPDAD